VQGGDSDGLIGVVRRYVTSQAGFDAKTQTAIASYLDFIGRRARGPSLARPPPRMACADARTGDLLTPAEWMRRFVRTHPAYRGDSVVPAETAYDLTRACRDLAEGVLAVRASGGGGLCHRCLTTSIRTGTRPVGRFRCAGRIVRRR
jgi:glutamate--cysteine ligase catalytic subunit